MSGKTADPGDIRKRPGRRTVAKALKAFINAPTWDAAHEILVMQQGVLLTDTALKLLREDIAKQREDDDFEFDENLEIYLHLLENAITFGIDTAWQQFMEQQRQEEVRLDAELSAFAEFLESLLLQKPDRHLQMHEQAIRREAAQALEAFINASTWTETREILKQQQEVLLSVTAPNLLQTTIIDRYASGKTRSAENLELHLHILEDAQKYGIEVAWQMFLKRQEQEIVSAIDQQLQVHIPPELFPVLEEIDQLILPQDIPHKLELIKKVMANIERQNNPALWAELHLMRGISYAQNFFGEHVEDIELAIDDFNFALQVFTREDFPHDWAAAHVNRGNAYANRLRGNRAENLEQAIDDFNAALEVFTREETPVEWALTYSSRGGAYARRILGQLAENIERAIADQNCALEIFTYEAMPIEWANTHNDRAIAYMERVLGMRAENLEQSISDYKAALEVFARETMPLEWAMAHNNRGNVYKRRILGNRAENLEQAIADYNAALEVRTRELLPIEWAMTHSNRGGIYIDRIFGDRAENLEQAIADYNAALEIFTREATPIEWAQVLDQRGNAYRERIVGNRAENLEQAIADFNAAFEVRTRELLPIEWATTRVRRGNAYLDRIEGNQANNLEQAISDFEASLEVFTRKAMPIEWAQSRGSRGHAYQNRIQGDRAENLEKAIADYDAVLEVFTDEAIPFDLATTFLGRGTAYMDRIMGDRAENLEKAIADFNAALEIFTRETIPLQWAMTCMNRGSAYIRRIRGEPAENLERAIADYNSALEVFIRETTPIEWAKTYMNRSSAFGNRILGEPEENLEQAINDHKTASQVFGQETFPNEYALGCLNLGVNYLKRIRGDRSENIEQAIANFEAAFEVFTRENFPLDWAHTHRNRGLAFAMRIRGDRAENLEQAITDCNAALEIYTRESLPLDWAQALNLHGFASSKRVWGDRIENLEQAIADYNAALEVMTFQALPREHRNIHLNRVRVLEQLERWVEAHAGYLSIRGVTRLLMETATTDSGRMQVLEERAFQNIYVRDAQALLHCTPIDIAEIVCILEEGRAQNLRVALALDAVDLARINDPNAYARATAFIDAREGWRNAQRLMAEPLSSELSSSAKSLENLRRHQYLDATYEKLVQARDAIRRYDDPDFLTPIPTFEQIGQSVGISKSALVYLAAGEENGLAVVVTRNEEGAPKAEYLSLPRLTLNAISNILYTSAMNRVMYEVPTGGLTSEQMGWAFETMAGWGIQMHGAVDALPTDCSFKAAGIKLISMWAKDTEERRLLDEPFLLLSQEDHSQLAGAFNNLVLNVELEKSLRTMGDLGLSELSLLLQNRQITSLTLIPYGQLGLFPMPSILVHTSDGSEQLLGNLFEVSVAPSARALEIARERALKYDRAERRALLTVGNPKPLPYGVNNLPFAEAEADTTHRIAKKFGYKGIRYFRPEEATKELIVEALEQAWFAQLALHGQYLVDEPRRSRLLTAGDESIPENVRSIFLSEVLDGEINLMGLRLLVLSACETALIDIRHVPDEVLGLAAGFLQTGAAGVIASLWAVDDRASYLLMSRFAQLYLDPQRHWSPAHALAEAQHWLREEATNYVLETYDPIRDVPLESEQRSLEIALSGAGTLQTVERQTLSSAARSLRYFQSGALAKIHAQAAQQALNAPNDLPYADPIYWAAFVLTGC